MNRRTRCAEQNAAACAIRAAESWKRKKESPLFAIVDCSFLLSLSAVCCLSKKKKKLPQPQLFLFLSLSSSSFQRKQATGMLYVDRILYSSVIYPANYGESLRREERKEKIFFVSFSFALLPLSTSTSFSRRRKKKLKKKLPKLPLLLLLQASSPRRSAKTTTPWTSSC